MSEKYNATCAICGQPYKICRTCQEIKSFTPWRTITDTLQHYSLFLVLSEYSRTKDKAKANRREQKKQRSNGRCQPNSKEKRNQ